MKLVVVERDPSESCERCRYFIDHRDRDDPSDQLGYCGVLVATHGLEKAVTIDEYGGRWTRSDSWCSLWQGGDPIWSATHSGG